MSDLIFACVNAGDYVLIREDKVVGIVRRRWKQIRTKWPAYEYVVNLDGEIMHFPTIVKIQEHFKFANYKGYGHVLTPRNYV